MFCKARKFLSHLHTDQSSVTRDILFMLGIMGATIFATELLRNSFHFAQQSLVLIYVLSVLIISCVTSGYICGLIAAVAGTLVCDFLIVTPRLGFSFTIGSPFTLITLLVVTLITSTLTARLREQKKLALNQERHFRILYDINRELLSARSIQAIAAVINTSLTDHVGMPVIFYTGDPLAHPENCCQPSPNTRQGDELFHTQVEQHKVHLIFEKNTVAENYSACVQSVPQEAIYYTPIFTNNSVAGVIGVLCNDRMITRTELSYIQTLASQVALAFELQCLTDNQERLTVDTEKEKTRSILLRAISHDLRTPMTTIHGASVAMLGQPDMPFQTRNKLLGDIKEYSEWLIRMVENILTITKISGDTLRVIKKAEAAEEVISVAVSIVRKRYPLCNIRILIPDVLLMVPMDATLISQVLINLLENAAKNSPPGSPIVVSLEKQGLYAKFSFTDQGKGISSQMIDSLFENYSPSKELTADAARSTGVGLSICKTIIDAHGGEIDGRNRPQGGAIFTFTLSLEETTHAV